MTTPSTYNIVTYSSIECPTLFTFSVSSAGARLGDIYGNEEANFKRRQNIMAIHEDLFFGKV